MISKSITKPLVNSSGSGSGIVVHRLVQTQRNQPSSKRRINIVTMTFQSEKLNVNFYTLYFR